MGFSLPETDTPRRLNCSLLLAYLFDPSMHLDDGGFLVGSLLNVTRKSDRRR
jgi:hypothetical protein